ncbi:DNA-directed RNA polymerase III subunit RPC7-like [Polymixia lowei]
MAGRGRGRGRRHMTFSVEAVGIGRGESLPPSILQPTPLFPPMEHKPVALVMGEEAEYMLALKQELRGAMKSLPFYIRPAAPKKDVERYSDKYHSSEPADNMIDWRPDWRTLPKELRIKVRRPQSGSTCVPVERSVRAQACQQVRKDKEEVIMKLETLEKREEEGSSEEEEGEQKKRPEGDEAEGEEEYDEEEFEEETDYIMSYFDNGEDFGGDSDDNMDEAIY